MKKKIVLTLIVLFSLFSSNIFAEIAQDDTVRVVEVQSVPLIDGYGNDTCWQNTNWQAIDQVWINYGESMDSSDFTGHYKILWSSSANLLYFLVEVTDDVFIDGWPTVAGDYYHFDIIEVFIDQDKSGGLHVFDGTGSTGAEWGTNAENAFSYHVNIDLPDSGEASTQCVVNDHAGTDWGAGKEAPNYASHFPEIALREIDGKYYWEFSLIVYNDSYDHNNPEAARVNLQTGDIIGLTLAYCDNDGLEENPKERDNFIGSVWVPEEASNNHWINADGFGTLLLVSSTTSVSDETLSINEYELSNNYPNPFNPETIISFKIAKLDHVLLKIYNALGQEVATLVNETKSAGSHNVFWDGTNNLKEKAPSGVYFYTIDVGDFRDSKKMIFLK